MRKMMTRSITVSTIYSVNVTFEEGQAVVRPNEPLIVNGNISEEKALKEVRKTYGENSQSVSVAHTDEVYEISIEDFIKHAKKVDMPPVDNPTCDPLPEGVNE